MDALRNLSRQSLHNHGVWIVCCFSLLLGACQAQQSSGGASTSHADYTSAYSSGQYSEAYEEASHVAGDGRPGRDHAALIAGLSAQALNRNADAEHWLTPLVNNADLNIAGQSGAALGLIAKERGDNVRAATLLVNASQRLQGDEAARALMYAGDCKRSLHDNVAAHQLYLQAQGRAESDASLRTMLSDRIAGATGSTSITPSIATRTYSPSGWSVQTGVFSTRAKADSLARSLSKKHPTRVQPIQRAGRTMYAVRVGQYGTKAQADTVRKSLGKDAVVVGATDQ